MPGNCVFNLLWLQDSKFCDWLMPCASDVHKAHCKYCKRDFTVTTMGITAVNSHLKSDKHKKLANIINQNASIKKSYASVSDQPKASSATSCGTESVRTTCDNYIKKNDVLSSEIWWVLRSVTRNYSFRSNEDAGFIVQKMFPGNAIAEKFSCGETKSMYLSCYGLAPYFLSLMENKVKQNEYVMLFDESLNKNLQKKQLDIHLRFWQEGEVHSRYYDSQFLGHARADDLVDSCMSSLAGLGCSYSKIIQVSSATNWNLSKFLTSLYYLFHDVPARREDYQEYSISQPENLKYPLKFCSHRWVENSKVAQRAIDILPDVTAFVAGVNKNKQKITTNSFEVVSDMIKDSLLQAKLATFVSIADIIDSFLVSYQTDKPMLPFISDDLRNLLEQIMKKFVKRDVLRSAGQSAYKLCQIDLTNSENLKAHSQIDAGFVSEKLVNELRATKTISDRQVLEFHMEAREFLQCLVSKIIEKSPLQYSLVRNVSCLVPKIITDDKEVGLSRFRRVLSNLSSAKHVDDKDCDEILNQYTDFSREMKTDNIFSKFDKSEGSLDKLYHCKMSHEPKWLKLWLVVRRLLLLSHGQATVERGFSINKQCTDDNISERSIKSRRLIKDHIASVGGLECVEITPELLKSAAAARTKYQESLRSLKVAKEKAGQQQKRKAAEADLANLNKRRKGLEDDITALDKSSEELYLRAETSRNITLVTRANNDRKRMREKQSELKDIIEDISAKSKLLRNM